MLAWILLWIIFNISKKKKGVKISFYTEITFFLFYSYVVAVLSLTIIPLPFDRLKMPNENGISIIPLEHIMKDLSNIYKWGPSPTKFNFVQHSIQNIFGNIILFIPLGIFLPLLSAKYRAFGRVIIFGALCSISIELTQFILRQFDIYRTVDIDDVILNTLGAILGFVIVSTLYPKKNKMY